jgi:hypothetical protein
MKFTIDFKDEEFPQGNRNYVADEYLLERTFGKDMSVAIINQAQLSDLAFQMKIQSDLQTWNIELIKD